MDSYIVMPERGNWTEIEATNHEMAYRGVCCWYNPNRKVIVINKSTKEAKIYTREIDKKGNLIKIIEN